MGTTHRHELRGRDCWREGGYQVGEGRGENWDNCNSIINKIYLKIRTKRFYMIKENTKFILKTIEFTSWLGR